MNWEIGDRKGDKKKKCYQKKDNKKINLGVDNLMNDIMGDWTFIKCRVANATKASIPCLWKRLGWWRNTPFLGVEIAIKKIYILLFSYSFIMHHEKNPLDWVTLAIMLEKLVDDVWFAELWEIIAINCFLNNPSIKSSLTFLRKNQRAREQVEQLYMVEYID